MRALLAALAAWVLAAAQSPNVLLVVLDDVAERDIDRIQTPRFDGLAAVGTRFRRAYGAPRCKAARVQAHFGVFHSGGGSALCDGTYDPNTAAPQALYSMAEMLRDAGYATGMFGKWHLGGYPAMQQGAPWELSAQEHGFDAWRAGVASNVNYPLCGTGDYFQWTRVEDGLSYVETRYQTRAVRDAAVAWFAEAGKPWFAFVGFQSAHKPFHEPPGSPALTSDRERYERMVLNADTNLGAIVDAAGPNTIVIVVGDNGTPSEVATFPLDPSKVKETTYEDGIRVPMVWAGPGIPAGLEASAVVSLVDIMPTVADLLGIPIPTGLDGVSLIEGPRGYAWAGSDMDDDYAFVDAAWSYREVGGVPELYHLPTDPQQATNLAGQYPGVEADRAALLALHRP